MKLEDVPASTDGVREKKGTRIMHGKVLGLAVVIAMLAVSATAQTVTGSGTTNTVPVFTGTSTVGNSPISVSGGNVGIGTTLPPNLLTLGTSQSPAWISAYKTLDMQGYGYIYGSPYGTGFPGMGYGQTAWGNNQYFNGSQSIAVGNGAASYILQGTGEIDFEVAPSVTAGSALTFTDAVRIANNGSVGIGTTSPATPLDVRDEGTTKTAGSWVGLAGFYSGDISNPFGLNVTFNGAANLASRTVSLQTQDMNLANGGNLSLEPASGNVGIGTASPSYSLDVAGAIHSSGSVIAAGGITFQDGTTQTTAFNPTLCGGDYAESVNAAGDRKIYEPGDVLVIAADDSGDVLKSSEPYSTLVAGIYSTKPGVIGRRQTSPKSSEEVPMAMVGIVPTKVTAENGPIHKGDLLVSSSMPGYAMRGTDRSRMLGAVIGKAMGSLESGAGVIEVLVTLQ